VIHVREPRERARPASHLRTAARIFALYSGLAVIAAAGIIFTPVVHHFLHRFHLDEERRK